jgi:Subtilase family
MLSPLFAAGPDQIVVELKPQAVDAPANLLTPAAPGGPLAGFALPPVPELSFTPMFRVGGPITTFAHATAPASFARPSPPSSGAEVFSRFLVANVPSGINPSQTVDQLNNADYVEVAYFSPAPVPALWEAPAILESPAATPNYVPLQGYLGPAPGGVDALYAWTQPGGNGEGITICDVEGGWTLNHEDLTAAGIRLIRGSMSSDTGWLNHGTAVLGEMLAVPNGQGCQGSAFAGRGVVASIFPDGNAADAIRAAADALQPGDILLIELHRPGPRSSDPFSQFGYLPMEFWRAEFLAIQYAITVRGVIVVEAAGNGSQNLDDPLYAPDSGREPQYRDSGAIMVGAGAPPNGLFGPDRSRLDFSNYGSRVDCQGWGRSVVTLGYGDLHSGSPQQHYTAQFSGTSSASPIVTAVCACVQSYASTQQRALLDCATLRDWLRITGSPQTNGPNGPTTQRIGNRPNLRELLARVAPPVA